ncbi:hypothetical protein AQUCO_01100329v1 [Aquilegia coerulea]|uniref:Uncharacterized protein n=1 Tax=Aquilegia coerulea TaxID=218851 RepID=A0A2G5E6M1_AQUCA|nr:hypothetical protein AQUCO_01100329v1 [Aquilegia coerulea]
MVLTPMCPPRHWNWQIGRICCSLCINWSLVRTIHWNGSKERTSLYEVSSSTKLPHKKLTSLYCRLSNRFSHKCVERANCQSSITLKLPFSRVLFLVSCLLASTPMRSTI